MEISKMRGISGKTVIVTGGGEGIGRATCLRFAEEGARVLVAEINAETGRQTAAGIRAAGGEALFVSCDVSDEPSVEAMVAESVQAFGPIHILINNAAVFVLHGIEASVEDWQKSLGTNVIGTALVAKHVVPHMRQVGGGAIVNLGSISSFIAQPKFLTYNATKAAIATMSRCMALDLAEDNIRVNAVCPGTVWTRVVERLTRELGLTREEANTAPTWGGKNIIQRIADTSEIAAAIVFLASDDASFITG
ncbi:MAG: SDR family NAD(P)-dependent oxidoreductase, partial [Planctomycetaceae bacterium]